MILRSFLATALATALLTAAPAPSDDTAASPPPSLSVSPDVLAAGGTATISYSNPAMAGQVIVVDIDDGMRPNTQRRQVEIRLDESGKGTAVWPVPAWDLANFNAPGVPEVGCPIL